MPYPKIPNSWFTPKGAVTGGLLSVGGVYFAIRSDDANVMLLMAPLVAGSASIAIIVFFAWLTGHGQRAYRFGRGRQDVWGYLGHNIRGIVDGEDIWISLADCEIASGLKLGRLLGLVHPRRQRVDGIRGVMVDRAGMIKILEACNQDFSNVNRLRVFLEREVWATRRG